MDHRSETDVTPGRIGSIQPAGRPVGPVVRPVSPVQVSRLLHAAGDAARDDAWADFLRHYSRLLLKVARRATSTHDEAMDRYAFILDQLRQEDFRRLRAFAADGRGRFTTWLVVVARRLCVDHHRRVHGRPQTEHDSASTARIEQAARRNLAGLLAGEIDLEQLPDNRAPAPDAAVIAAERHDALADALGSLDPADQLLLTLRFEDGLPLGRIGPLVGLESRFQVHRRLKQVLAQLRESLRVRGITHP